MWSVYATTKVLRLSKNLFDLLWMSPVRRRLIGVRAREHVIWRYTIGRLMRLVSPVRAMCDFNLLMEVRPEVYADLTALFGRPAEKIVYDQFHGLPEGATVIDIGANIGRYTLLAAKCVGPQGRVLAFEPDPSTFAALQRNVLINQLNQVVMYDVAVSNIDGYGNLIRGDDPGWSTLEPEWLSHLQHGQLSNTSHITVRLCQLDSFMRDMGISKVDLLKIDVEGNEIKVLLGAHEALTAKVIRKIICEVHSPVVKPQEVIHYLNSLQYRTDRVGASILAELVLCKSGGET